MLSPLIVASHRGTSSPPSSSEVTVEKRRILLESYNVKYVT